RTWFDDAPVADAVRFSMAHPARGDGCPARGEEGVVKRAARRVLAVQTLGERGIQGLPGDLRREAGNQRAELIAIHGGTGSAPLREPRWYVEYFLRMRKAVKHYSAPSPKVSAKAAPASEPRDVFLAALGERVRSLRARKGMTRKALAVASDVSQRHLANLEL